MSHEGSNHRSKKKDDEEEEDDDDDDDEIEDDEELTDGGELTETEIPFFICPSSTIHCRPDGDTNESTSHKKYTIEKEGEH